MNKATIDTRVIPKTSHSSLTVTVTKQPTCSQEGTKTTTCKICGEVIGIAAIPKTKHVTGDWIVVNAATCTKDGSEVIRCTECNEVLDTRNIPQTGHEGEWKTTTQATCLQAGIKSLLCKNCGETLDTVVGAKTGHVKGKWTTTKQATCTSTGLETVSCIYCGTEMDTRETAKSEHRYSVSTTNPSCEREGVTTKTCQDCGDVATETIPAWGHKLSGAGEVIAATCETDGYTKCQCSLCYQPVKKDIVPKLGHNPSEWKVIQTPDCSHTEIQGIVCLNCGKTLEQTVGTETGDHIYELTKTFPAYSCRDGYTLYTYKACGMCEMRDIVPATGNGKCIYDFDNYEKISDTAYSVPCKICGVKRQFTAEQMESTKQDQADDALAVQKVTEVIGEIITDDMTDVEKIYAVNDWICRNCVYDEETYNWVMQNGGILFSCDVTEARGVMLNGLAVCSGYTKAFKEFMNQLGIECLIVRSRMMNHTWNQVRLDDGWYWIDCTFSDSENKEGFFFTKYFLLTEKKIYNYVTVTDEEGGTECNGIKYLKGAHVFDKYSIDSQEDINDMYKSQRGNDALYFKTNTGEDNGNYLSALRSEYQSIYGEKFIYNTKGFTQSNAGAMFCIKNSDKVTEFFENRIAESEETIEEVVNAVADADEEETDMEETEELSETETTVEEANEETSDEKSTEEEANEETSDEKSTEEETATKVASETEITTEESEETS